MVSRLSFCVWVSGVDGKVRLKNLSFLFHAEASRTAKFAKGSYDPFHEGRDYFLTQRTQILLRSQRTWKIVMTREGRVTTRAGGAGELALFVSRQGAKNHKDRRGILELVRYARSYLTKYPSPARRLQLPTQ